jgi:hypothetical protein
MKTEKDFTKIVRLGTENTGGGRSYDVFCKITYKDGRLSVSGVEGPTIGGDCLGACGQIVMHLKAEDFTSFAPGWDKAKLLQFLDIWDKWHLNDMQPGCEHQRAAGWETGKDLQVPHYSWSDTFYKARCAAEEGTLSLTGYEQYKKDKVIVDDICFTAGKGPLINPNIGISAGIVIIDKYETKKAGWVYEAEHPDGLLGKPCPVCGYKYGSQWLKVDVPADALDFLRNLPDTDKKPAWV